MALADFFPRDSVAISQVLQGFQIDAFTEKLEGVRVAIAFGEEAVTSRDGARSSRSLCQASGSLVPEPDVYHPSCRRSVR